MDAVMEFVAKYEMWFMGLYMVIEFVLGKTEWVKANSVLESLLNGAKSVLEFVGVKKDEPKELPKE